MWVIQKNITELTNVTPLTVIGGLQDRALGALISANTISNLIRFEAEEPANAYTAVELLNDVRKGVFTELVSRKPIDVYRRQLQKSLVERLIGLVNPATPQTLNVGGITISISSGFSKTSDGISLVKAQLKTLAAEIRTSLTGYGDAASKNHLQDLQDRIKLVLEPK